MARTCPIGFDVARLREQVSATYERVAHAPDGEFHFHRGMDYACDLLGYDRAELERLPPETVAAFAGLANPLRIGPIAPGERVLDIGCGAGTDLLLAALRTGPTGRAIGVDLTPAMRERATASAAAMGFTDFVDVRPGTTEALPVDDASIDVVISNGAINLSPDKDQAFAEIWRVLAPGGRLYLGDVIVSRELSLDARSDVDLWAAWISGALPEAELHEITAAHGFVDGRIVEHFDSFRGTSALAKVSRDLRPHGANFFARKPG